MGIWKSTVQRAMYRLAEKRGFSEPLSPTPAYGIRSGYRHRPDNAFFDDTPLKDEWQKEIYQEAARIAAEIEATAVADVGCGSGYKLVKNFPSTRTIGFDLEPTLSFLRRTYPDREWRESRFGKDVEPVDLVICSDVIEHIPDPDELMDHLLSLTGKRLVLSTPERVAVYGWDHSGPPGNPAHCREWTADELQDYVSGWFRIDEARITNRRQGTQMLVCSHK